MDQRTLHHFLQTTLGLDLSMLSVDRYKFLCELIDAYDRHLPFQNLSHTGVPFCERQQPSMDENIAAVLRKEGGRCWTLNGAMHVILHQLGYAPLAIMGGVATREPLVHLMNLVRDLRRPGDVYLIDVGFTCPAHQPVPLDFDGSASPVYQAGYLRVRWIRDGEMNGFIRQQEYVPRLGKLFAERDGDWENAVYFNLTAWEIDDVGAQIGRAMYNKEESLFNLTRRIAGANSGLGKYVAVLNDKLLIETKGPVLKKTQLANIEEVLDAIKKYFPDYPLAKARAAYEEWFLRDRRLAQKMAAADAERPSESLQNSPQRMRIME